MATQVQCNDCGRLATPDIYGLPPKGWYHLTLRGTSTPADFCSARCLERYAIEQRNREMETAHA